MLSDVENVKLLMMVYLKLFLSYLKFFENLKILQSSGTPIYQQIFDQLKEDILTGKYKDPDERFGMTLELMETVGLDDRLANAYPHELDGGRRQRVGIARALAMDPKFIVCDEPVSALDVSIQAQILNLLRKLQKERNLTYIFITHDLSVVNYISDEILVMYLGRVIEKAKTEELFARPVHPYTKALLSALPIPSLHNRRERILIKGEITSPINPKPCCRFAARCEYCTQECLEKEPPLVDIGNDHWVACFKANEMQ